MIQRLPILHFSPYGMGQRRPNHTMAIRFATHGSLDLDAGITEKYGVPSPKTYEVTTRMMMAQVIGGDNRPGETWRYDELGNMWLHLFPQIIEAATEKKASYWLK